MSLQLLENKALSRGIIGKSAPILAEITIRKSQDRVVPGVRASKEEHFCIFIGAKYLPPVLLPFGRLNAYCRRFGDDPDPFQKPKVLP